MNGEDNSQTFLGRWSSRKRQHQVGNSDDKVVQLSESQADIASQGVVLDPTALSGETLPLVSADIQAPARDDEAHDHAPDAAAQSVADAASTDFTDAIANAPNERVLTDADMPSIESLDASSDVSGFFSKGVSAALRKAALRQLFKQPQFNVRDGLNDYDGDYTVFEPLGDTITADMKFHAARKERDRLAAEAEAEQARLDAEAEQEKRSAEAESEEQRAAAQRCAEDEESLEDSGLDSDNQSDNGTENTNCDENGGPEPDAPAEQHQMKSH